MFFYFSNYFFGLLAKRAACYIMDEGEDDNDE